MFRKRDRDPIKVKKLSQVGIVVRDLNQAMDFYQNIFGIGPWMLFDFEPFHCEVRGCEISPKIKIALAYAGGVQFELIQVEEGRTIHQEFLEEGREGLHHLGFFVYNLEERLKACRERGIEVLERGSAKQLGSTIHYAYLDTAQAGGVILEYIQSSFLGIPVKMWPPLVKAVYWLAGLLGK